MEKEKEDPKSNNSNKDKVDESKIKTEPPKKPPKLEDKPFEEFINQHLIPSIKESLKKKDIKVSNISLSNSIRPVVGDICWVLYAEINNNRKFWLCFSKDNISSIKTISLAETDSEPGIVESFLIDEKKITLSLLISRLLQRLNGQKWIGPN